MAVIYRQNDRKKVTIGDTVFSLAPLTFAQKSKADSLMASKEVYADVMEGTIYIFQCSVKSIEGIEYSDGTRFEVEFEDGIVKRECIEEILGMPYWLTIMTTVLAGVNAFDTLPVNVTVEGKPVGKKPKSTKKTNKKS